MKNRQFKNFCEYQETGKFDNFPKLPSATSLNADIMFNKLNLLEEDLK